MLKKIAFFSGSILMLVLLLAIIAPYFINNEYIKNIIIGQIQHNTGFKIAIDGQLNVRMLPFPKMTGNDISIKANPEDADAIVSIKELDIGFRFIALLKGKVDIHSFTLNEPTFNLVRNKDSNNWDVLTKNIHQPTAKQPESKKKKQKKSRQLSAPIALDTIAIRNATVNFQDNILHRSIKLKELDTSILMNKKNHSFTIEANSIWNEEPLEFTATINSIESLLNFHSTYVFTELKSKRVKLRFKGMSNTLEHEGDFSLDTDSISRTIAWLTGDKKIRLKNNDAIFFVASAQCSISDCQFTNVNAQYNKIALKGSGSIQTEGDRPYIITDLQADNIDLSSFTSKEEGKSSPTNNESITNEIWDKKPYPLQLLETIDGSFKIQTKQLVVNKFEAANITLLAKLERGFLSAEAANIDIYGGKTEWFVNINRNGKLDGRSRFTNIALEPLLTALNPDNRLTGKANGNLSFSALAFSDIALVSTFNAIGNISISDGSIKNLDIAGMARNIQSAYKDVDNTKQKTDFSELSANYTIANGIIKNDDLVIKAPLFRANGKGTANLPKYTIDYRLNPQIVETIQGQGGKEKTGFGVPILVTGNLNNPQFTPNLKGAALELFNNPEKMKENVQSIKGLVKKQKSALPQNDESPAPPANVQQKPINQLKGLLKGL